MKLPFHGFDFIVLLLSYSWFLISQSMISLLVFVILLGFYMVSERDEDKLDVGSYNDWKNQIAHILFTYEGKGRNHLPEEDCHKIAEVVLFSMGFFPDD